jgi:hypothetical protein
MDRFAALATTLPGLIGDVRFKRLRSAVEDLDFVCGAAVLREARVAGSF